MYVYILSLCKMVVTSFVLCFVFCICGNDLFSSHVVLLHIVICKAIDDKLENMYNAYVQCFEAIYNIYSLCD